MEDVKRNKCVHKLDKKQEYLQSVVVQVVVDEATRRI